MDDINYPEPKKEFKVFVRTNTYNQSQYITDTLDGVAMQQTDFPFVHFVMDDASTDGEQDVIIGWLNEHCDMANAEYIDIPASKVIIVEHLVNPNCAFAIYLLKHNIFEDREEQMRLYQPWREHSKYEAICDGDDFWISSEKLQKQIDFLDQNNDYVLCYHNVFQLDTMTGNRTPINSPIINQTVDALTIARGNVICTLSAVYRIIPKASQDIASLGFSIIADYPHWLLLSQYGKFYRFPDFWAVYRFGIGIWSSNDVFLKRNLMHLLCVSKTYGYLNSNEQKRLLDTQIRDCYSRIIEEYYAYVYSRDYKLGNYLLRPIRFFKRIIKKIKQLITT